MKVNCLSHSNVVVDMFRRPFASKSCAICGVSIKSHRIREVETIVLLSNLFSNLFTPSEPLTIETKDFVSFRIAVLYKPSIELLTCSIPFPKEFLSFFSTILIWMLNSESIYQCERFLMDTIRVFALGWDSARVVAENIILAS